MARNQDQDEDRGSRNRQRGDGNQQSKKAPPKSVGTMGHGEPQVVDGTRSLRVHVQFLKGTEALIGNVTFRKDGVAISAAVSTDRGGSAAIVITGLPLAACSFTMSAELDDPFTPAQLAVVLPKAEKKDPNKIGSVEFLEVERQPSTGRNIIPILVYDEDGKVKQDVEVWLIDAACDREPIPRPKDTDRIYRTDNEGRVAITYTLPASERSRDVMVVVPRKPGASKRYVLRGPDPVKRKILPVPTRQQGESLDHFRQRCRDAGRGVVR